MVGIDPVSVRFRTNNELWVVNHISDSVSVVDFTFELPGAELLDRREALRAPIARLRQAGVRFGLGDYGRDFAAVHVLTQLPIDVLRIDIELLDATASANSTSPTLIALVRKAHQLGAAVLAPGMNTLEHAHIYTRLGIPVPRAATAWITAGQNRCSRSTHDPRESAGPGPS